MGVSSWMRGSSPRMTQSVWPVPLKKVIAGLNRQSSTPFTLVQVTSVWHRVSTRSLPGSTRQSMMPFTLV